MTHGFLTFSGKRYELTNWEEEDDLLQEPNSYISMMEDCVNGGIPWWHLMIIFFKASFVFENLDWKLVEMFFFFWAFLMLGLLCRVITTAKHRQILSW